MNPKTPPKFLVKGEEPFIRIKPTPERVDHATRGVLALLVTYVRTNQGSQTQ